ncbi:helix-turn-helix domain-containing protein [Aquimarina latercula]|uniref:helix-turn-helix domain-containing protein n=1 Tax=Aquimarina latercula TaxID=987 RepID=UPI0004879CF7|nr:helix-turn-helix domain-containing protein [Aquimarina latercula]
MKEKNILVFIPFLFSLTMFSFQNANENLEDKSFDFLSREYYKNKSDSVVSSKYAFAYLNKGKKIGDPIKIADGYFFLSLVSTDPTNIEYNDSIIIITKNNKTKNYPTYAYLNKANIYYEKGLFKESFDNFLQANKEAVQSQNTYLIYDSKKSIGILKSRIGENESALLIFNECLSYYSQNKNEFPYDYLTTLFALSDSYRRNKKLDSSYNINKVGYNESIDLKNDEFKTYFTFLEGINNYEKGNFIAAKDSLIKSINFLSDNDRANEAIAHFYLGKTNILLNKNLESINEFKKVDDIFQDIKEILPETRESYEILINHFKHINDKDNQLKYIERLIEVDSLLYSNYRYLIKNVVKKYDTPQLIQEKQKIISALEKDKNHFSSVIIVLIIISIILLLLWVLDHHKKKVYKRRFESLYVSSKTKTKTKTKNANSVSIGISQTVIDDILIQLDQFEANKEFLNSKIQTALLAKRFNTNSRYLSKVINTNKKMSFSNYINELRINYVVNELKNNVKLRNYTIDALAKEIGFNNRESFSKAFFKKTGIYPSYFIKEIEIKESL